MQITAHVNGGSVQSADEREFGRTIMTVQEESPLFKGLDKEQTVWMSHGDRIESIPGATIIASSDNCPFAAVAAPELNFHGVQFHPEVVHTENGSAILKNWLFEICGCRGDWKMGSFIEEEVERLRKQCGDGHVVLGLSGGVDSSVAAVLLDRAIGEQLHCVFVNNGLLRKGEAEGVQEMFKDHIGDRLIYVDASERFLRSCSPVFLIQKRNAKSSVQNSLPSSKKKPNASKTNSAAKSNSSAKARSTQT